MFTESQNVEGFFMPNINSDIMVFSNGVTTSI
jgi:hypothetical protein